MEQAMFGAGCFWGVEAAFARVPGVIETAVGYAGGTTENPTYEQVCTDQTGHAEVVHLKYNPKEVAYDDLLQVFWECHNPTQVDGQGPDIGRQYRSAIFYYTPEQKEAAEAAKHHLEQSGRFRRPIATEITEAPTFYRAEDYHQRYFEKRGIAHGHL